MNGERFVGKKCADEQQNERANDDGRAALCREPAPPELAISGAAKSVERVVSMAIPLNLFTISVS
jgi:hypothetical protein